MNHIYHLPEHQTLRDQVQRFIDREVEPHAMAWEEAGSVPRDVLKRMGDAGFFGLMYESEYGGAEADALTNLVFAEALSQSDRKSTRLNSSHIPLSRMPSSA